jgi:serine/threonine protein kinase
LLDAQGEAGAFLSRPLVSGPADARLEGRRIGPYRLQAKIGQGGMGAVYRAVREDDAFQKTVALKLVHAGATREHLARLARERQILARLQHPNIAVILDGGTTDAGHPYLVLEHVDGTPIDAYCDARGLGTRARLALFHTVCAAVHYAHQNLVVHRDLKPANILVSADGAPKVLDFGIAKLLAAGIDPEQAPTATLLPLMTPEYASPEQVRGQSVTTASDVYSLGIVLYELLTGVRPYAVRADSLDEIVRAVCETEPQPPSSAARTKGAGTTTVPPMRKRPSASELKGDLDTIVLKALRKEPSRRYLSVLELAEDVRRHLEGLPVLARKDTVRYRMSKFVGRHRAAVVATALVFMSLAGGLAASLRQARIAEANRIRAERRFAEVRALSNAFLFEFHDAIKDLPGSTAARQLVVRRAAEHLDALREDAREDVGLQRELAAAYQRLADAQGGAGEANLGDTAGARANYEKALAIRRALAPSGDAADVEALAHLEMKLSRLLAGAGEWDDAVETARSSALRLESLAGKTDSDLRGRLAAVHQTLSFFEARRGDEAAAHASLRKALAFGEAYDRDHPEDVSARASLARIRIELAERLERRGERGEAAALVHSAWAVLEALIDGDPNNARYRRELVYAINVGASVVEATAGADVAHASRSRALELAELLVAAEPGNQGDQIALTYAQQGLGAALVGGAAVGAGLSRLRQACQSAAALAAASDSPFHQNRLAEVHAELGLALARRRLHPAEMCVALRTSVAVWERLDC